MFRQTLLPDGPITLKIVNVETAIDLIARINPSPHTEEFRALMQLTRHSESVRAAQSHSDKSCLFVALEQALLERDIRWQEWVPPPRLEVAGNPVEIDFSSETITVADVCIPFNEVDKVQAAIQQVQGE